MTTVTMEQIDQLLPGIPNEITLSEIAPKLPWSAFRTLSSVNRDWQDAIRSRHTRSSETLVVLNHIRSRGTSRNDWEGISLYSMRDNCCYQLPPIPFLSSGIPEACSCVTVDGKIFIIGGLSRIIYEDWLDRRFPMEMYVLDVAGKRQWKQCASMRHTRQEFGCGIINGKIYVFGGNMQTDSPLCESEVYDPEADTWSSIEPMISPRSGHSVVAIGEELFVYGGYNYFHLDDEYDEDDGFLCLPQFVEVYHPVRNEWRVIGPFGTEIRDRVFTEQGKFYSMTYDVFADDKKDFRDTGRLFTAQGKFYSKTTEGIYVHDDDFHKNTWTQMHSFSPLKPDYFTYPPCMGIDDCPVLAIEDELLTISSLYTNSKDIHFRLLRSKGFGSKTNELVWEEAGCPLVWDFELLHYPPFLCPFQL